MADGAPSLGHEGEGAFSLVAGSAEQHVAGFRVDVEFAVAGFFHGHEDSGASAFVAGVGEDRDLFQVGAGLGEDELAGGGDVVGAAGQRGGDPQRDAGGTGEGLDEAGVVVRLPRVPFVYFCALLAGFLVGAAVGGDEGAVEDQVGKSLLSDFLQGVVQVGASALRTSTPSSLYR